MSTIASQTTSLTIVYSTVYSDADQRKHQSSASLAFVRGIHRGPVNSPRKWPVTREMFPFDDVIMSLPLSYLCTSPTCNTISHIYPGRPRFETRTVKISPKWHQNANKVLLTSVHRNDDMSVSMCLPATHLNMTGALIKNLCAKMQLN